MTERAFARMVAKPDWGIYSVVGSDGRDHVVSVEKLVERPFGDLIHFKVQGREPMPRRVFLVAPMSGHYATLLRSTVNSLLPDAEVYITDWHNARDIPVSEGKFDVEDYTLYLVDFMRALGPDINVIAVCQPAPLTLAATAYLAELDPEAQPQTLTLIGGPIDPDVAATEVTDFGSRVSMGHLEEMAIQRVGFKYKGAGRMVYPGLLQLAGFMSMNSETHSNAFQNQISAVMKGEAGDHDKHNKFYDEYLAVMDMTAEFYLSTVERIFKNREIAKNEFTVKGHRIDIGKITDVAIKTVEGSKDDITAPGQCAAALPLCTGAAGRDEGRLHRDRRRPLRHFRRQVLAQPHPPAGARVHRPERRRPRRAGEEKARGAREETGAEGGLRRQASGERSGASAGPSAIPSRRAAPGSPWPAPPASARGRPPPAPPVRRRGSVRP